ncbi:MAG TPA: undecaprenyl-diphosphatase UppP [Chloroflexota bacterium]
MDLIHAIVLGIVQGLAEPLPISSSGHLILVPWLLGWSEHTLTFDVALHGGTAFAIIVYFWRDWIALIRAFFAGLAQRDFFSDYQRRLALYILVASIPGAVLGVILEATIEEAIRIPALVAVLLMAMGIVLMVADRVSSRKRSMTELTMGDAIIIGLSQALALVPGVSRSGITITTALLRGINRADSARFSFLLSGPITTGAFLYNMAKMGKTGFPADERLPFLAGIVAAAIVGYAAISFLLGYLQKQSLSLFVYYRLAFGAFVLAVFFIRG